MISGVLVVSEELGTYDSCILSRMTEVWLIKSFSTEGFFLKWCSDKTLSIQNDTAKMTVMHTNLGHLT